MPLTSQGMSAFRTYPRTGINYTAGTDANINLVKIYLNNGGASIVSQTPASIIGGNGGWAKTINTNIGFGPSVNNLQGQYFWEGGFGAPTIQGAPNMNSYDQWTISFNGPQVMNGQFRLWADVVMMSTGVGAKIPIQIT